jgi:hypothetical protein
MRERVSGVSEREAERERQREREKGVVCVYEREQASKQAGEGFCVCSMRESVG